MSINEEIINRIDVLLLKKHLKRNAAYDFAGIAHNSFSNWCRRDSNIPVQALFKIAQFLGVSVEYLLTGKNELPPNTPTIPQKVLDLAYEINALPEVYRKIIFDTVRTLKESASEKEQEKKQDSGFAG